MGGYRRSGRDGPASQYCAQCGTDLERRMHYCPNCGVATDRSTAGPRKQPAAASRSDRRGRNAGTETGTSDRDRLEHRIARASREGWRLEHDFGDRAVMVRRTFGNAKEHLAVALVTVWFTMGIGNALWGAYRYFGDAERLVLRADRVEGGEAGRTRGEATAGSGLRWRAVAGGCWLVAAIVAVVALEIAAAAATVVLVALAVLFATLGASALPSVRRRLEGRHPFGANGQIRSVEERTVVAPDRPCAACAEPVGRGLERIYRDEFCALGVPLTVSEGRNYYCRACANAERPGAGERTATESAAAGEPDRDPEPEHA
ncbi:zinc ribbon domain-containing protein [Haloterrigena sp. SYSU A558-1]|uniref:Zinc ribbon domain-containing protein n=1 Tax=Haloterrigena gelatinilytica TaxID=2741724 RepID=A0ABX2L8L8_9EURY|nr:zinc ribbon domain-containing protein [Haloterrigena gelatinilytica]NUC71524.1 zinc ribbon domain-containing protein [Haloterrigena gelatinilytica]